MKIKYITNRLFYATLFLGITFLASCKKQCTDSTDPKCPNYDACSGKRGINADFTIREQLVYTGMEPNGNYVHQYDYPETDTAYVNNLVVFEAKTAYYDSLKWFIGAEVLTEKQVRRRSFPERHVPITLVVYYKSFLDCNPGQKWTDTVTKSLYTVWDFEDIPISGVYEGYNTDAPNNLFTIQVNDTTSIYPGTILGKYYRSGRIQQLPQGSTDEDMEKYGGIAWGGKNFFIGHFDDVDSGVTWTNFDMYGKGSFTNGEITIDYSYENNSYQHFLTGVIHPGKNYVSKTFIGKKIRSY